MPPFNSSTGSIKVTGPVGVFVTGDDQFLGTCQIRPHIRWRREWEPIFNDLGGRVPFDMQYMGADALVLLDINYDDSDVIQIVKSLPTMDPDNFGLENLGDIGSLMIQEDLADILTLKFPYTDFGVSPSAGLQFPRAFLLGPDEEEDGTRHQLHRLIFYCMREYNPVTQGFKLVEILES